LVSRPLFTIAIPTKNRPGRLKNAIKSVLEQTFPGLELVVCDNSDEAESRMTAAAVEEFSDPRVRYIRTNGRLSMPDNWEAAVREAQGEYVGILTDRSVFRRDALEVVREEIGATGARFVNWPADLYGRDPEGKVFKRRACTFKRYRFTSERILDYFVHGHPKFSTKVIPKLMTSVCHRAILDDIRASGAGRVCLPVAPDFTSGFLMLGHCEWILTLDEPLYVSCGTGNGAEFRRRGELADRFRRDLGMEWHEMVDRMPSEACFAHALVLNDLMRVRDLIPDRLPDLEINRAQYYLGCLNDYQKTSRGGVTRDEDLDVLLEALEREPSEIKDRVMGTRLYARSVPPAQAESPSRAGDGPAMTRPTAHASAPPPGEERVPLKFENVWDALAWDEANPRPAAAESFLDLTIGLDDLRPTRKVIAQDPSPGQKERKRPMAKKPGKRPKSPKRARKRRKKVPIGKRARRLGRRVRRGARVRPVLRKLRDSITPKSEPPADA
jgi:glycosyltransferase involved in cell wall biosynthesis